MGVFQSQNTACSIHWQINYTEIYCETFARTFIKLTVNSNLRWLTTVLSNSKFLYTQVSCTQLRARKYQANEGLCKEFVLQVNGFFTKCACSRRSYKTFFNRNFLKILPYNLCSIFYIFKYRSISIFRQLFFKICRRDFKIIFKIPIFDIFVDIQKALLQIFILTCKNICFDPKFKW